MNWKVVSRRAFAPVVALGLVGAAGAMASGCGEDGFTNPVDALCCEDFKPGSNMVTVDWGFEADANLQFGVFMQAVGDLSVSAAGIISAVGVECEAMAKEMGEAAPTLTAEQANSPPEHAKAWCGVAFAAVAGIKAEANLTIDFQPPRCEVEASAQADCEVNCQVDASCDGGSVQARCEGGELSGKCDAKCEGKCEGSASVAVECSGTCSGTCRGECSAGCDATVQGGAANGDCAGKCEGTCEGKCEGTCEIDADAEVTCDGTCTGSCEVDMKAPKCSAEIEPPSCEADANCSGGCKASASAKAECHPPQLTIEASGNVAADLEAKITTLRLHLPNLIAQLVGRVELVKGNVDALGSAAGDLAASGELDVSAAFCIIPAAEAMVGAGANIAASAQLAVDLTAAIGN